ncbi:uncharacterized protein RAG0_08469 [Rhynchosporium agropyri]|uniref:Uncharacterized protein n=1 Tax=Rhynchosporium agropyri TaxID=914238 RepID=A0A1E1KQZ8_9HELO|nr:uncharacterized protein RAG0_08469 [Rhynchosporium agropyri]
MSFLLRFEKMIHPQYTPHAIIPASRYCNMGMGHGGRHFGGKCMEFGIEWHAAAFVYMSEYEEMQRDKSARTMTSTRSSTTVPHGQESLRLNHTLKIKSTSIYSRIQVRHPTTKYTTTV